MQIALLIAALVAASPTLEVRAVDGRTITGTLTTLTADRVVVQTPTGDTTLKRDELLSIAPATPAKPTEAASVFVELVDGSQLSGTAYEATKTTATLTISAGDKITLPVKSLRLVRFSASSEATDAQWAKALDAKSTADLLVVRKKDALDVLEGIVGAVDADKVSFELDREALDVKRPRVDGFIFARQTRDFPDAACTVEDAAGGTLQAQSVELADGKLSITTTSGIKITRPLDAIARLDFSASTIRYLSDLKPESVEWTPFFSFPKEVTALADNYKPRRDRDLEQGPLRLGGKKYTKGLGLSSRTTIVFRVPTGFRAFKAIAGIDDAVRDAGNVRLEISGDDKPLLAQTMTGKDDPRAINLDVTGIKRLTILVDYGDDSDVADHVNFCEARFTK